MRGHTLRHIAVTGAIAFTAILTTIGVVVSLRHHRCGEPELLPIDGDPKALVAAIIRKHGGEEALKRRNVGIVKTRSHAVPRNRHTIITTSHEVFRCPDAWKIERTFDCANRHLGIAFPVTGLHWHPDHQLGLFDGTHWYRKGKIEMNEWCGDPMEVKPPIIHPLASLNPFFIDFPNPLLLRDGNARLKLLGTRDVNGREAVGLHVQWLPEPTTHDREFYFDRQTGFLVLSQKVNPDPNDPMLFLTETEFKDYVVRDGVAIPETLEQFDTYRGSGRKLVAKTNVLEASFPETIDDNLLKIPNVDWKSKS
jgi:hypothetical protein